MKMFLQLGQVVDKASTKAAVDSAVGDVASAALLVGGGAAGGSTDFDLDSWLAALPAAAPASGVIRSIQEAASAGGEVGVGRPPCPEKAVIEGETG